jgi:hypothetical protein
MLQKRGLSLRFLFLSHLRQKSLKARQVVETDLITKTLGKFNSEYTVEMRSTSFDTCLIGMCTMINVWMKYQEFRLYGNEETDLI